ncbi:hypothetical protein IIM_05350 [Bacillus cereus VD107]|nr:hypothetical protein IIM_05350 [Bacillus cereus VD107]
MLGILFTAAPSTDVVKDLQDKVISLHEHEVSFLNDTIANMLTMVGIGVAIITAFFSWAYVYVKNSNKKAQEKMAAATEQLEMAEGKNKDLDQKMAEANQILIAAKSMANTAQDKLAELEREQEEIKKATERLENYSSIDVSISLIKLSLDNTERCLQSIHVIEGTVYFERRISLFKEYSTLMISFYNIQRDFQVAKIHGKDFQRDADLVELQRKIKVFSDNCDTLKEDIFKNFQGKQ